MRRLLSRGHALCFTAIFHKSTYKAMKIVLSNKTPAAVLRIMATNIGGDLLPVTDETTGNPTLKAGSLSVSFDTSDIPVDVSQDSADETRVTFTKKKGSGARLIRATATAANEDGVVITSAPLEIEIQADGIAAGLIWAVVDAQTAAAAVQATGAAIDKKDESQL